MMSSYAKNKLQMCSVTQRRIAPFWVHVIPADPPWCETLPTHFTQRKRKRKRREVRRPSPLTDIIVIAPIIITVPAAAISAAAVAAMPAATAVYLATAAVGAAAAVACATQRMTRQHVHTVTNYINQIEKQRGVYLECLRRIILVQVQSVSSYLEAPRSLVFRDNWNNVSRKQRVCYLRFVGTGPDDEWGVKL